MFTNGWLLTKCIQKANYALKTFTNQIVNKICVDKKMSNKNNLKKIQQH
jgi:hypothetical protein